MIYSVRFLGVVVGCFWLLTACSLPSKVGRAVKRSPVFSNAHAGFVLADASTGRVLVDYHGGQNFTPASNIKLFTLYTALCLLPDTLPGLQFAAVQDTVWIRGTGDPTFASPYFEAWQPVIPWLKAISGFLVVEERPLTNGRFGKGWAWDDFQEAYQPERSEFPMFGNTVAFALDTLGNDFVKPDFFKYQVLPADRSVKKVRRDEFQNRWYLPDSLQGQFYSPFRTEINGEKLYPAFLSAFTGKSIYTSAAWKTLNGRNEDSWPTHRPNFCWQTIPSCPLDTVLRRMMYQSDNFIAEQLLLMCSGLKNDSLNESAVIRWALDSLLVFLPGHPKWADGSGLSRYNLASPKDFIALLHHMWKTIPHNRLLSLFPKAGNPNTTLSWMTPGNSIFAKTGSMSGIQCMSGYWMAPNGKTYIFCFLNNHFVGQSQVFRQEIDNILNIK